MADVWHYLLDDEAEGPVSRDQLRELADAGVITPEDLVWRKGTEDWIPARKVRGLFQPQSSHRDRSKKKRRPSETEPATGTPSTTDSAETPSHGEMNSADQHADHSQSQPAGVPLPILLIGLHAGVTAAVTLLQSSQTSSTADLGSQLGSVTGMLGGLFGNAMSEAGLPSPGTSTPQIATSLSNGVGWFASVLAALTVPLIVFQAAVCYGLFTHQWWARRIALITYVTPILMALVSFVSPMSLGSPAKLTIDALIAAGILYFLTRRSVREYFGDDEVSWSSWASWLKIPERESD
ncbi:DUF4339 domain-containing protein [Thalassoroseus pseudoceratinae]|uniref:DUF4339 domain-containing protein n=1 Tax=Thalassoroseus pseudoceratinae TaxID=2713176 RepID=UPI0014203068|nr:DUF4339 domain-containing protein [Thalassoroseus pseudoceratinae]